MHWSRAITSSPIVHWSPQCCARSMAASKAILLLESSSQLLVQLHRCLDIDASRPGGFLLQLGQTTGMESNESRLALSLAPVLSYLGRYGANLIARWVKHLCFRARSRG